MNKLVVIHHRLTGMGGHRFNQALDLLSEGQRRGREVILFISADADEATKSALCPPARAVLHDPVFRLDLSFDERTQDFLDLLDRFVTAEVQPKDLVLMTVATQCEARGLSLWLSGLPADRKPFVLILFVSDRWNRYGPEEHKRQMGEFAVLARELSSLDSRDANRLLFCAHTTGIAGELSGILGVSVFVVPLTEVHRVNAQPMPPARPPLIAMLGGARPEKGSDRIPAIVNACRNRIGARFLIQGFNEQLSEADYNELVQLEANPSVEFIHGALTPDEYFHHLAASDIVLLPYVRTPYRQRPSAIFSEAVGSAKILVVPTGTWMAQQIEEGRAVGAAYQGDTAEAIAQALDLVTRNLPALSSKARNLARAWTDQQSLSAFFDRVEAEIVWRAGRIETGAMPKSPDISSSTTGQPSGWNPEIMEFGGATMTRKSSCETTSEAPNIRPAEGNSGEQARRQASEEMSDDRAEKTVFGCVAENSERFLSRALHLSQSVRWFGGGLATADIIVCVVNGTEPSYRSEFERLGARVVNVPRFNGDNPFANKMQFFGLPDLNPYDRAILLDCDTMVVSDPSPFLAKGKLQAKIADVPTVPTETLSSVCRYFGLTVPEPLYRTTFGQIPTIWYCNSGVLVCPLESISNLVAAWREYEMKLTARPDLLGPHLLHRGQAALTLAFLTNPLPFEELPPAMNFPLHLTHLEPPRAMLDTDPVILHYHNCVDQAGYLFPSPYPRAQKFIRMINNRRRESRQSNTNWSPPPRPGAGSGPIGPSMEQRDGQAEPATIFFTQPGVGRTPHEQPENVTGNSPSSPRSSDAKIICILGMHRSGTSLITRLLNLLGVYLGAEEHTMLAGVDNPRGYWEHSLMAGLNEEILARLGGSWHEVPALPSGWERTPELSDLRKKARGLIQETFSDAACWGWKDPRNSLTLPFWRSLLPPMQHFVCIRNPIDTALSLQRRNGLSFEKCIDLWLAYVASALHNTAGQSRLIVFYEDFMDDWSLGLQYLARFLGMPERADQPEVQRIAEQFVEQSLYHHRTAIADVVDEPGIAFAARAFYLSLRSYCLLRFGNSDQSHASDQITQATLESLGRSSIIAQDDTRNLQAKVRELQQELARSNAVTETLSSALGDRQAQLDRITDSLGWRLLSYYGRVKHRYLLPSLRFLRLR